MAKCWSTPLDPRMPPENRAAKDHTNSRAVFYAVRPWAWRDKFAIVNRTERELLMDAMDKYRDRLPFPEGIQRLPQAKNGPAALCQGIEIQELFETWLTTNPQRHEPL